MEQGNAIQLFVVLFLSAYNRCANGCTAADEQQGNPQVQGCLYRRSEIAGFLGEPEPYEIERKFLISIRRSVAKMHPALVPIKNDDPSIATLQQVDKMIVQVNREKGLGAYYPDYVQSDAELVDHIGEIVSGAWCGPEGMQIAGTLAKEGICVICTLEDIRRYKEEQL